MKCKECRAKCCSIFAISLLLSDVIRIAKYLEITTDEFINKYTANNQLKYRKIGQEDYCIFVNDSTFECMIHDVSPEICQNFKCQRYE